jgi:hypothetical protein
MPGMFDRDDRLGAWIPITDAMRSRVRALGPRALERLHAFGLDDRRESAFALVLAGAAPLAGLLLLDWDPVSVLLALFLNLLTVMAEDVGKILRSIGRRDEMQREATEDQYVWRVAASSRIIAASCTGSTCRAMRNWTRSTAATATRSGFRRRWRSRSSGSVCCCCSATARSTRIPPGSSTAPCRTWRSCSRRPRSTIGTSHPHWRRAGSVRLQTSGETGLMVMMMGLALMGALSLRRRDLPEASSLALVFCAATIGYGLWRALRLLRLSATARWLKTDLERPQPLAEARERLARRRVGARRPENKTRPEPGSIRWPPDRARRGAPGVSRATG